MFEIVDYDDLLLNMVILQNISIAMLNIFKYNQSAFLELFPLIDGVTTWRTVVATDHNHDDHDPSRQKKPKGMAKNPSMSQCPKSNCRLLSTLNQIESLMIFN